MDGRVAGWGFYRHEWIGRYPDWSFVQCLLCFSTLHWALTTRRTQEAFILQHAHCGSGKLYVRTRNPVPADFIDYDRGHHGP